MPRNDERADSGRTAQDAQPQQNQQAATQQPDEQRGAAADSRSGLGELFASAAVRWGIGVAGFVLFLFALGQAVGLDLLGMFAEALGSQTGQWLVVAVFGLFLVAVARRGIGTLRA
ncbi:hypothetical protein [Salinigranum sp.]|uniref:hypothetical protein n=1 Tax=Salinigranum sp. TaxID=1966351 RepID=UPI0035647FFF